MPSAAPPASSACAASPSWRACGRTHQIADAAKAIAEGAAAASKGEEEPPDVGRSLAQLFSA